MNLNLNKSLVQGKRCLNLLINAQSTQLTNETCPHHPGYNLSLIIRHNHYNIYSPNLPKECPQLLQGSVRLARGWETSTRGGVGGGLGFFQPLHLHVSD